MIDGNFQPGNGIHHQEVKMKKFAVTLLLGIVTTASAFQSSDVYKHNTGRDFHSPLVHRNGANTIIVNTRDTCPVEWVYGIPHGNRAMRQLWDSMCSEEAHFTVRAGQEFLVYGAHTLVYTNGEQRSNVMIYPEELWSVMNQCYKPLSPVTGEISMEVWFPSMEEPTATFITAGDPAMSVIQVLLERGREAGL